MSLKDFIDWFVGVIVDTHGLRPLGDDASHCEMAVFTVEQPNEFDEVFDSLGLWQDFDTQD